MQSGIAKTPKNIFQAVVGSVQCDSVFFLFFFLNCFVTKQSETLGTSRMCRAELCLFFMILIKACILEVISRILTNE